MNKIILIGNICRDIEVKHYNDRKNIKNSIAVKRDFKNKDGEYDTDFFNFTLWGSQAEFIEKYAKKGDRIAICGKVLNNNYENGEGVMVYSNDIQVEHIELLTPRAGGQTLETEEAQETQVDKDFKGVVETEDGFLD